MKSHRFGAFLSFGLLVILTMVIAGCVPAPAVAPAAQPAGEGAAAAPEAAQPVSLVYMTAGDVNMLALAQNVLGEGFKQDNPTVDLRTVHTGPGDAGSRLILEKLKAEKDSGKTAWDVDVAMVHQVFMGWAMEEDLLQPYAKDASTWQYVTAQDAANALGTNIEGYGIPMFHSQTAIAYNPEYVTDPPTSYEELVAWAKENPQKFGYNGVKGGMSGVAFTVGWVYWKTGAYDKLAVTGPVEKEEVETWKSAFDDLKEFNKDVTLTAGNVGTLDGLNRGELWMGPVWVDMFYTFMKEGKLDPNMRLTILEPGMPGQPMYFVIPKHSKNAEAAKKFVEYVTSPEIQGSVIIDMYNWYPGIDGQYVKDSAPPEAFERLYKDISPEMLAQLGLSFPIADYFQAMLESYETWVIGG
jgi:putative spermidine/putrescine transport system substrate-binding protein